MTLIVGALAIILALILYFWLKEPAVDVLLNTLSLAVATIPESLPIVLIFALALGAHQMASRKAVIRRLAVVESLGSVGYHLYRQNWDPDPEHHDGRASFHW